jgi:hypothetical protein
VVALTIRLIDSEGLEKNNLLSSKASKIEAAQ